MQGRINPVARIAELPLEPFSQGDAYRSADAGIAERIGLTQIGASYSEVPPGKSGCPCHVHHVEDEMFVILEGEGTYRFGAESYPVRAGDVLGAPRGGVAYAHKLTNTGNGPLKYLSISTKSAIEVCEYPDSGKFMVSSTVTAGGAGKLRYIGRGDTALDYWDGEDAAD
jgi:uncharacterized cupin superfamily protein